MPVKKSDLYELRNVGPATVGDLKSLGITSIKQLAKADPTDLYLKLEKLTKRHQNTCVWDVFAAIVHEAQTGEPVDWWKFTPIRHTMQRQAPLCPHQRQSLKKR